MVITLDRVELLSNDINYIMRPKNIEVIYHFESSDAYFD